MKFQIKSSTPVVVNTWDLTALKNSWTYNISTNDFINIVSISGINEYTTITNVYLSSSEITTKQQETAYNLITYVESGDSQVIFHCPVPLQYDITITIQSALTEISGVSQNIFMLKSVYDANGNGIVDDSEKLGNQLPSYYASKTDLSSLITTKTLSSSYTIAGGGYSPVTFDATLSGYTPILIGSVDSGSVGFCITSFTMSSNTVSLYARNLTSSSITATAKVTILYIKT